MLLFALAGSRGAQAQTVSDVLTFLIINQGVETGSVERDREAALAASATISRALLVNLATLTVPTSSSGFVYRLNPELGTVERATRNFGPFFVERALTAGRGHASLGLTFQHLHFTSLGGHPLRDGTLITTANRFVDESTPFDVDRLALAVDASVMTLSGNVGVTNHVEIGVAVPMVSLSLDGSRVNTYRGRTFTQAAAEAHAIGVADLVMRTKFMVYEDQGTALAAAVDLRLPSGRREDLLGSGKRAWKLTAIGSLEGGRLAGSANVGIGLGGLATELSYAAALLAAASSRVTLSGELLGRFVDSPGGIVPIAAPHPTLLNVETIRLTPTSSRLNMISVAPGFKWNVSRTWVLAGNVSIPLTDDGLSARFTPFIGVEYALGR